MENAGKRWAERAARGLTDEQLVIALVYEIGHGGSDFGPADGPYLSYCRTGASA